MYINKSNTYVTRKGLENIKHLYYPTKNDYVNYLEYRKFLGYLKLYRIIKKR